jgi:hypothetical protein
MRTCIAVDMLHRPVVPGGARGAMTPPDFGVSVNPISTMGDKLCPPNITGTPGFSDLPTVLIVIDAIKSNLNSSLTNECKTNYLTLKFTLFI